MFRSSKTRYGVIDRLLHYWLAWGIAVLAVIHAAAVKHQFKVDRDAADGIPSWGSMGADRFAPNTASLRPAEPDFPRAA